MPLEPDTTRRLAYIRLLAERAVRESRGAPPFSYDAVSRMHDAVESMLALAAQVHHVKIPRAFADYWTELETPLERPLTHRSRMERLNKARVNLKHYGIEPAPGEVVELVRAGQVFMEDESEALFGVAITDLSLHEFIADDAARAAFDQAQDCLKAGDRRMALGHLRATLELTIRAFERSEQPSLLYSHLRVMATHDFHAVDSMWRRDRFFEATKKTLTALDERLLLLALGIDIIEYTRFLKATSRIGVFYPLSGDYHVVVDGDMEDPDDETVREVIDFVVGTAVHLAARSTT